MEKCTHERNVDLPHPSSPSSKIEMGVSMTSLASGAAIIDTLSHTGPILDV
jgi:hypothetical protein